MKINILCNYIDGGWKPTDTRLGGTEESIVRWSQELTKRGHDVIIYDNDNRDSYNGGGDVCINVKSSEIAPKEPTLYLTNETDATDKDLSQYLGVIWPSSWALENIPVNNKNLFVLPHGYDETKIYPDKKIRKQCFYASSPDRGLILLLQAWPEIHQAHPDAHLYVTYGAEEYYVDGVTFMGEADEETMNQLYRKSEYWLHPCTGGELFGITGIKAQVAGCWPIYVPTMALSETVRFGSKSSFDTFAKDTIEALKTSHTIPKFKYSNWSDSTDRLLEIINGII